MSVSTNSAVVVGYNLAIKHAVEILERFLGPQNRALLEVKALQQHAEPTAESAT